MMSCFVSLRPARVAHQQHVRGGVTVRPGSIVLGAQTRDNGMLAREAESRHLNCVHKKIYSIKTLRENLCLTQIICSLLGWQSYNRLEHFQCVRQRFLRRFHISGCGCGLMSFNFGALEWSFWWHELFWITTGFVEVLKKNSRVSSSEW